MSHFAKKCSNCKNYEGNIRICESCAHYDHPITLFDHITASPEVLAEKLLYAPLGEFCKLWYSTVLPGEHWNVKAEAIAATLERLKEVEK